MTKLLSTTRAALIVLSILFICAPAFSTGASEKPSSDTEMKNEVIIANAAERPFGWDPVQGWGDQLMPPLMQSKLVNVSGSVDIIPELASDFFANENSTEWTFKLREDVKFSDGTPFTAKDVAFTIKTVKAAASSMDYSIVNEVEVLDDYTVVMKLAYPSSTFIYHIASLAMIPSHAYDANYSENPIGTGPYKMVQWDKGQQVILEANPYYYGDKPEIERLIILFMDYPTALASVKAGKVDVAYADISTAIVEVPNYTMNAYETVDNMGITMPYVPAGEVNAAGALVGNDVTSDIAIRKALSIAVDREQFSTEVLSGYGTPSYSLCSGLPWNNEKTSFEDGKVDEAKKILEDAGWLDSNNDGIREKNGIKASFEILYPSSYSIRELAAVAFSQVAKEIGIEAIPTGSSWDELLNKWHSQAYVLLVGDVTPNELYQYATIKSAGIAANMGYYHNETVETYLEQAMLAATQEEAIELWKKVQWDGTTGYSMVGDAPVIWLSTINHMYFVRDGLDVGKQGLQAHSPYGMQLLNNITEWSWN